jgi:pilus assembly protein CpaE
MATARISNHDIPLVSSINVIAPNYPKRGALTHALAGCSHGRLHEFSAYPRAGEIEAMLSNGSEVVIMELDTDPELALDLIEKICTYGTACVIALSEDETPERLLRCMRAGAREFLPLPISQVEMEEALIRASIRRPTTPQPVLHFPVNDGNGGLYTFVGAKGGAGTTMLACNFAVALAQESAKNTLLIDLSLPLGDAAIYLGIRARYTTLDALLNSHRLDYNFLSTLFVRHSTGLAVLAAPTDFTSAEGISNDAIDTLVTTARQVFDYVVVDAGSRQHLPSTMRLNECSTVYLVTQVGIPELRNANRFITQFEQRGGPRLEVVVNRYDPRSDAISETHVNKALTRPAQWKISNDYKAVRQMQNTAIPIVFEDSLVARTIRQMAISVCGKEVVCEKKKKSRSLFRR